MVNYAQYLKTHLAAYKRAQLAVDEDGVWRGNGRTYPHILPEGRHELNIVAPIREAFWDYQRAHAKELPLHTDFHHLNSSQAFAFNLLFPWLQHREWHGVLLGALGLAGETIIEWTFEHMPDQAERTTVDLYLECASGRKVLVEVKLTEQAFGSALPDESHKGKLESTYRSRLSNRLCADGVPDATFFLNYQLFRNICQLDLNNGDCLIALLPRSNELAWGHAQAFKKYLSPDALSVFALVAAEDLVEQLLRAVSRPGGLALPAGFLETCDKYLLREQE